MPDFDIYTLPESEITISGGGQLSGFTQGDGSHLDGLTITLNSNDFQVVTITDSENFFADSDSSQTLKNAINYDGTAHAAGLRVEAEYTLTVEDPDGNTYTLIGFNINEAGGSPSYGTVEGLAFLNDFPPVGVPLTVTNSAEGPGGSSTPYTSYFEPPCFVAGTRIRTPEGDVLIEDLGVGDLVETLDHGPRPLVWIGAAHLTRDELVRDPSLCPVRMESDGLVLLVSPQHRILVSGWQAQLFCGEEVLAAAKHLARAGAARVLTPDEIGADGVTYWHLMFDAHEIVFSNGIPSESFCPGPEVLRHMPEAAHEFARLFPGYDGADRAFVSARRAAKRFEAEAVAGIF